ncbi:MAG TPA: galactokinase [Acidobacteriaceae bacterium]
MPDAARLTAEHVRLFGAQPTLFIAPGRVNLIGEHTDYAGGFVMPAAIDFATLAAVSPREDNKIVIRSDNFDETIEHDLDALPAKGNHHWSDYPIGVVTVLRASGIAVKPFSLSLDGDVPLGAGLSSSASIEVASALATLFAAGTSLPPEETAKRCQRAENGYVGANSGIMDQFIACCGRANNALLLDCRSLAYRLAPIPEHLSLVICNTMVKHSHAGGEYNTRRAEVEQATAILRSHRPEIELLRDASVEDLEEWGAEMPPNVLKRARHIITDSWRAVAAADALDAGDLKTLGRLMAEAHISYRDDFEASVPEADLMVDLANQQPGLVGARLTGGGFGGCTVNLVENEHVDPFIAAVGPAYEQKTGIKPEIYRCKASDAAHQL